MGIQFQTDSGISRRVSHTVDLGSDIGNPHISREILTAFRKFSQEKDARWVREIVIAAGVKRIDMLPPATMLALMTPAGDAPADDAPTSDQLLAVIRENMIGKPHTSQEILTAFCEFAQEKGLLWIYGITAAAGVKWLDMIPRKTMLALMTRPYFAAPPTDEAPSCAGAGSGPVGESGMTPDEILTMFREFSQEMGARWVRTMLDAEKVVRFSRVPRTRMVEIMIAELPRWDQHTVQQSRPPVRAS